MKKTNIGFLVIALAVIALVSLFYFDSPGSTPPADANSSQLVEYGVAGYIKEIKSAEGEALGIIYVEGSENNGATYQEAYVTVLESTKIYTNDPVGYEDLEVGMYVNVFFEGPVLESYPVQATAKQINIIPKEPVNEDED
ncbi:DUF3221 domain-containing protein [Alkaliphilus serpentinus]|nr:DUF3221 domain-containing protein [Alkaliphilus serpentinus]